MPITACREMHNMSLRSARLLSCTKRMTAASLALAAYVRCARRTEGGGCTPARRYAAAHARRWSGQAALGASRRSAKTLATLMASKGGYR